MEGQRPGEAGGEPKTHGRAGQKWAKANAVGSRQNAPSPRQPRVLLLRPFLTDHMRPVQIIQNNLLYLKLIDGRY